jgi:hypothetical protein
MTDRCLRRGLFSQSPGIGSSRFLHQQDSRPDARAMEVADMVLELFIGLGRLTLSLISDRLSSGKLRISCKDLKRLRRGKTLDFHPLLETIIETIPCPERNRRGSSLSFRTSTRNHMSPNAIEESSAAQSVRAECNCLGLTTTQ